MSDVNKAPSKSGSSASLSNIEILRLAWRITGGWAGVVRSSDFYITVLVWILTAPYWLQHHWWDQVISVLPSMLGFTLGGFAIFLGFGSDDFKRLLVGEDVINDSPYLSVSSAFLMFVAFQLGALLYALCAGALRFPPPDFLAPYLPLLRWGSRVSDGIGYFLFLYSLILSLRAALRIFRVSRWYNDFMAAELRRQEEEGTDLDRERAKHSTH